MSCSTRLKDKVCVVTGAAGVLCSHMVEVLLENGAKVVLLGRTEEKLVALSRRLADAGYTETMIIAASVLDEAALEEAKKEIHDKWGPVHLLINGAGGNHPGGTTKVENCKQEKESLQDSFFGLDLNAFSEVYDLNFKGTLLPCQIFGRDMIEAGSGNIINISSMAAERPLTKIAAYASAKSSIDNFTRWLAVHLAHCQIRVNAIAPGFFVTDQNRFLLYQQDGETLTERGQKIITNTPMTRFGQPEDLKSAVEFLANPASRFVTGIVIPVDGGFSAYSGV